MSRSGSRGLGGLPWFIAGNILGGGGRGGGGFGGGGFGGGGGGGGFGGFGGGAAAAAVPVEDGNNLGNIKAPDIRVYDKGISFNED